MNDKYYAVIMAGGVGSRFWPVSRNGMPKQFLDILGVGKTFLQMTVDRFAKIVPKENILIVTAAKYKDLVAEQLPEIAPENVLLEPYKRNTAPCIAYATYKLISRNPDATVVVSPSDHYIADEGLFTDTVCSVMKYASTNNDLFTIGIKPTSPNVNYGYIQANKKRGFEFEGHKAYAVKTFTEKPDAELAKVFVDSGEFLWNSGIFIWNLKTIKGELENCLPNVASMFAAGEGLYYTDAEPAFINKVYEDSTSISIDYGVMEKTRKAHVFEGLFGWSDLGTWQSLYEQIPTKDADRNAVQGEHNILTKVSGSVIYEGDSKKLVVVKGLKDYMVIDTADALMICPRDDASVKEILVDLAVKDKESYL
ncbi:MAG: mannose-1-phosphate guanylyltransferase [Bacteroidales bacterium]|nr:mannose-1-phosphate guanylyltransferase [Bacteroidales bacterium]MBR5735930.1 mannose-1-phosphate guanylyltransferase [Bacteroidales bacterium]